MMRPSHITCLAANPGYLDEQKIWKNWISMHFRCSAPTPARPV